MSEFKEQIVQENPETAFHARILHRERQKERRLALLMLCSAGIVLLGAVYFFLVGAISSHPLTPSEIILNSAIMLAGIGGIAIGITQLFAAKKPVTLQEAQRARQQARMDLLQRAQGHVPLIYRRSAMVLQAAFGVFWILMAVIVLLGSTSVLWVRLLFTSILGLVGIFLLVDAVVIRPQQARQVAAQSMQELAHRLSAGEGTEGAPSGE